jgi:hypothetical protein
MTTNKLDALIQWVGEWPDGDQEELVAYASEIEARRAGPYHASPEELRILDEAMAAARRGEIATDDEVEAVFANFDADEGRILPQGSRRPG